MASYTMTLDGDAELKKALKSHADTDFSKTVKATTVKLL